MVKPYSQPSFCTGHLTLWHSKLSAVDVVGDRRLRAQQIWNRFEDGCFTVTFFCFPFQSCSLAIWEVQNGENCLATTGFVVCLRSVLHPMDIIQ